MAEPLDALLRSKQYEALDQARQLGAQQLERGPQEMELRRQQLRSLADFQRAQLEERAQRDRATDAPRAKAASAGLRSHPVRG